MEPTNCLFQKENQFPDLIKLGIHGRSHKNRIPYEIQPRIANPSSFGERWIANHHSGGDWFNVLDFSGEKSAFGVGLPPKGKNGHSNVALAMVVLRFG